jgi:hypothetical protein
LLLLLLLLLLLFALGINTVGCATHRLLSNTNRKDGVFADLCTTVLFRRRCSPGFAFSTLRHAPHDHASTAAAATASSQSQMFFYFK